MRVLPLLACLVLSACGDDGGTRNLPDAPPSDGTPDTPDPPLPVTLTVVQDGEPVANVDVYFQNPDSSLVMKVATNANGVASAVVDPGGFVTAVDPFMRVAPAGGAPPTDLRTFAGVKPGDQLRLTEGMSSPFEFVTVTTALDTAGFNYRLFSTCMSGLDGADMSIGSGANEPSVGIDVQNCTGGTMDVVVTNDQGSGAGNYFYEQNVAVTETIALDETYVAMPQVTVSFTDIPENVYSGINYAHSLRTTRGPVFSAQNELSIDVTSASGSLRQPPIPNATAIWASSPFPRQGEGEQTVLDWKPFADPQTFSYTNALLRAFTSGPDFDVATRKVTWTEDTTGQAPDVAVVFVGAFRNTPTPISWNWVLAGPPDGASVQFPTLPTGIDQFNILATDTSFGNGLATAKVPGGYDAIRPHVLAIEDPRRDFVAGTTGRVVFQEWQQPVVKRQAQPPAPFGARAQALAR